MVAVAILAPSFYFILEGVEIVDHSFDPSQYAGRAIAACGRGWRSLP